MNKPPDTQYREMAAGADKANTPIKTGDKYPIKASCFSCAGSVPGYVVCETLNWMK